VTDPERIPVAHVLGGEVVEPDPATAVVHTRDGHELACPPLALGRLATPRTQPPPAAATGIDEILQLLAELGKQTEAGHPALDTALDRLAHTSTMPRRILERQFALLPGVFDPDLLRAQLDHEVGIPAVEGWHQVTGRDGACSHVRAHPPRLVHVLAGNSPLMAAVTIAWTALLKGVGLIKMAADDPFTATALLRMLAELAPDHPTTRSFSAVYWRGGDEHVESALLRPQFFDKVAVWGGERAVRQVQRYTGPGLELVSFDPKSSISLVGAEAFADAATLAEVADRAAADTTFLNQEACASSRVHLVEGDTAQVDAYCDALLPALGREREFASAAGPATPAAIRDEVEVLRDLEPDFRVLGGYDGTGLVVRSAEPVEFHPDCRTVNVVPVASLADGARHATVATQTVGVYPAHRKAEVRDRLADSGVQRIVALGDAGVLEMLSGLPHDGFPVLSRLSRWVVDQGTRPISDRTFTDGGNRR
jgi:hypothetical protein